MCGFRRDPSFFRSLLQTSKAPWRPWKRCCSSNLAKDFWTRCVSLSRRGRQYFGVGLSRGPTRQCQRSNGTRRSPSIDQIVPRLSGEPAKAYSFRKGRRQKYHKRNSIGDNRFGVGQSPNAKVIASKTHLKCKGPYLREWRVAWIQSLSR